VLLSTSVFIYFKEYSDTEQSLTDPEKLVETAGTSVTLLESMMTDMANLHSEWIRYISCSLHHQRRVNGSVRGITRIYIPWRCKQTNRLVSEAARQMDIKRKIKILAHH
jgi:hypothetical protein